MVEEISGNIWLFVFDNNDIKFSFSIEYSLKNFVVYVYRKEFHRGPFTYLDEVLNMVAKLDSLKCCMGIRQDILVRSGVRKLTGRDSKEVYAILNDRNEAFHSTNCTVLVDESETDICKSCSENLNRINKAATYQQKKEETTFSVYKNNRFLSSDEEKQKVGCHMHLNSVRH